MRTFLQRFGALLLACLAGFDRIRFRGTKLQLCHTRGIQGFLPPHKSEFRTLARQNSLETLSDSGLKVGRGACG